MTKEINQEGNNFERLLGLYLKRRQADNTSNAPEVHLDDDVLASFVEGNLSEREAAPVIRHLIGCNPCRRVTAQLARLAEELGEVSEPIISAQQNNSWSALWRNLTDGVFSFTDEAILAYQNENEKDKETPPDMENNQSESSDKEKNEGAD